MTEVEKVSLSDFLAMFVSIVDDYRDNLQIEETEKKTYREWIAEILGELPEIYEDDISVYFNKNKPVNISISESMTQKEIQNFISYITSDKKIIELLVSRLPDFSDNIKNSIIKSIQDIVFNQSIILPNEVFTNAARN